MHLKREILQGIRLQIMKNLFFFISLITFFQLIFIRSPGYITENMKNIFFFKTRHNFFIHFFFVNYYDME